MKGYARSVNRSYRFYLAYVSLKGHVVAQLVDALCYKPKGRRMSPNEVDFFILPNPSSRTVALDFTQPVTQMSTRNLPGG
jgi:hypothetical protein